MSQNDTTDAASKATTKKSSPTTGRFSKNKKLLLIGIAGVTAAIALIVLGYNFWYQNPDKVLADSAAKLLQQDDLVANATVTHNSDDIEATTKLKYQQQAGNRYSLAAQLNYKNSKENSKLAMTAHSIVNNNGSLYVKIGNANSALDALIDTQIARQNTDMPNDQKIMADAMMRAILHPIAKKLDNQWVVISPDDFENNDNSIDAKCVIDTAKQLRHSDKLRHEVADVYAKNSFLVLNKKLGSKDGSLGYTYTYDKKIAEKFGKAFEKTDVYKKLSACDNSKDKKKSTPAKDTSSQDDKVTFEVWANRWSHKLTQLKMTVKDSDGAVTRAHYAPDYDAQAKVKLPKDTMTIDQLKQELGGLFD